MRQTSKDWKTSPPRAIRHTFGAVARRDATVLILGSMPGVASLAAQEYYAHPQNQFWPIMGHLFGAGRDLPYAARLARLQAARVALWDVCAECVRPGSMDHAIRTASVKPNDFAELFRQCPAIRSICCNGQTAARLLHRHVDAALLAGRTVTTLPSSSPAHAGLSFAQKLRCWAQPFAKARSDGRKQP